MASAWALAELLGTRGLSASPVHRGEIRSRSLSRLVEELGIELNRHQGGNGPEGRSGGALGASPGETPGGARGQIIVVDGSPSNENVSLLPGTLVGVIDHHCRLRDPEAPFLDLRPELASCSTLIQGYWAEAGLEPPARIATALLAGIQSDTDFLSRRAGPEDLRAYAALFALGDFQKASRIVRTVLDLRELELVKAALRDSESRDGLLWAWIPGACGQEVLAVLAEFVLRTEELRAAVIAERDPAGGDGVHLSVRSKDPELSAFRLVMEALDGIGSGGGHSHAAGGMIPPASFPGEAELKRRFFSAIAAQRA